MHRYLQIFITLFWQNRSYILCLLTSHDCETWQSQIKALGPFELCTILPINPLSGPILSIIWSCQALACDLMGGKNASIQRPDQEMPRLVAIKWFNVDCYTFIVVSYSMFSMVHEEVTGDIVIQFASGDAAKLLWFEHTFIMIAKSESLASWGLMLRLLSP